MPTLKSTTIVFILSLMTLSCADTEPSAEVLKVYAPKLVTANSTYSINKTLSKHSLKKIDVHDFLDFSENDPKTFNTLKLNSTVSCKYNNKDIHSSKSLLLQKRINFASLLNEQLLSLSLKNNLLCNVHVQLSDPENTFNYEFKVEGLNLYQNAQRNSFFLTPSLNELSSGAFIDYKDFLKELNSTSSTKNLRALVCENYYFDLTQLKSLSKKLEKSAIITTHLKSIRQAPLQTCRAVQLVSGRQQLSKPIVIRFLPPVVSIEQKIIETSYRLPLGIHIGRSGPYLVYKTTLINQNKFPIKLKKYNYYPRSIIIKLDAHNSYRYATSFLISSTTFPPSKKTPYDIIKLLPQQSVSFTLLAFPGRTLSGNEYKPCPELETLKNKGFLSFSGSYMLALTDRMRPIEYLYGTRSIEFIPPVIEKSMGSLLIQTTIDDFKYLDELKAPIQTPQDIINCG